MAEQSKWRINKEIRTSYDNTLAVKCHNGTFVGKEKEGIIAYKGIPYAKPPVGLLRWQAPILAEVDEGVYEAYEHGKKPIQTGMERKPWEPLMGEDCLTLNIWTSLKSDLKNKAVMVWIHGGAFAWGSISEELFDGHRFAKAHEDIILVTVEYRQGILGFIDFSEVPGGEAYRESGNLGLLDQVCALQWIQKNIRAFGGDPENVTIFGESGGASSCMLLPLIKEAKGLFKHVIAESGHTAMTHQIVDDLPLTKKLLEVTSASSMAELMALSEEEIIQANKALGPVAYNMPERDGVVLPKDILTAYRDEEVAGFDLLIGSNSAENHFLLMNYESEEQFISAFKPLFENYCKQLRKADQSYVEAYMNELLDEPESQRLLAFANDIVFRCPIIYDALCQREKGRKAYVYYWAKSAHDKATGAYHGDDIGYVLGNRPAAGDKTVDDVFAKKIQKMWVNFAKTGDPSIEAIKWQPYESEKRLTMYLADEMRMVSDPLGERRKLADHLRPYSIRALMRVFYGL